MIKQALYNVETVSQLILEGKTLVFAGEESLIDMLPEGNWIAGTTPYFMEEQGGCMVKDKLFVNDFSDFSLETKFEIYNKQNLSNITKDAYDNGFTYMLLPFLSEILSYFALNVHKFDNLYTNPLTGWVAGVDFEDFGRLMPTVFIGKQKYKTTENVVAMHVKLPEDKVARVEIINIFRPDGKDIITFPKLSFAVENCFVNGIEENFADYITNNKIDVTLPLVANYSGAMINVSFNINPIDAERNVVNMASAVFPNVAYRMGVADNERVDAFINKLPTDCSDMVSNYNCIANFIHCQLFGKKIGDYYGPFVFGEIGYMLLNQTFTYLIVEEK